MMASLITSLVSLLIFVFLEVVLLVVVAVMRTVIAPFAHTLLIVLVLGIIRFMLFLFRRRHYSSRSSADANPQSEHSNPGTLLQIYSHKIFSLPVESSMYSL